MSVTLTIDGNHEFCKDNELQIQDSYPCGCVDQDTQEPDADCVYCDGKGTEYFYRNPFELNISNGNFRTFFNALGLEPGDHLCGEIATWEIVRALGTADDELIVRAERTIGDPNEGPTIIDCGIVQRQAEGYITQLRTIAAEAVRRGKHITWA